MKNVIPFNQFPFWSEDILIGGFVYRFQFTYNSRFDYWALSIMNTKNEHRTDGIKIVLGQDLTYNYKYRNVPAGSIIPTRVRGSNTDRITKQELIDGDVVLVYEGDE